jgi:glycosyltransferase involved in cell wall biosynthesis
VLFVHICTVAARHSLAKVRVLARTFVAHHPATQFTTLVVDGLPAETHDVPGARCPAEIGVSETDRRRMALVYDEDELARALLPSLLMHLRADFPDEAVIFLEPGTVVFGALDDLAHAGRQHGLALVPRMLQPFPRDGREPSEPELLASGVFDDGVLAVGPGSDAFLKWWAERLRFDCTSLNDIDQPWLDVVPTIFDASVFRDAGIGVRITNLHERRLERSADSRVLAGGLPLRTLHLRGYDVNKSHVLDPAHRRNSRARLDQEPVLAELLADYRRHLQNAGIEADHAKTYRYGVVAGGPIPDDIRRFARLALLTTTHFPPPPLPFGPEGDGPFLAWLNHPEASNGDDTVTRMLLHIWRQRSDLQWVFRVPNLTHISELANWARTADDFKQRYGHLHREVEAPERNPAERMPGLNIVGWLQGEFGLGEAGRLMVKAAAAAGIPHRVVSSGDLPIRHLDPFAFRRSDPGQPAPYAVNLLCVNSDCIPRLLAELPTALQPGPYRVGLWFWEVDQPQGSVDALNVGLAHVDEVWVTSEFVADLFRPYTDKPVLSMPLAVIPPAATFLRRADLGLPDDRTVFVASFDFLSTPERKNPAAVVRAYRQAVGPSDGAHLVIKSINGSHRTDVMAELFHLARDRPDIEIRDGYVSRMEMHALLQLSDAYISLHRAEGFGLGLATSMAAGKPVIATGYSGNLAFMDSSNALLVPYHLTFVGPGNEVYPEDGRWAEPDLDAAATHIRWVLNEPTAAAALGRRARESITRSHGLTVAGEWITRRLVKIVGRIAFEGAHESAGAA